MDETFKMSEKPIVVELNDEGELFSVKWTIVAGGNTPFEFCVVTQEDINSDRVVFSRAVTRVSGVTQNNVEGLNYFLILKGVKDTEIQVKIEKLEGTPQSFFEAGKTDKTTNTVLILVSIIVFLIILFVIVKYMSSSRRALGEPGMLLDYGDDFDIVEFIDDDFRENLICELKQQDSDLSELQDEIMRIVKSY